MIMSTPITIQSKASLNNEPRLRIDSNLLLGNNKLVNHYIAATIKNTS